MSPSTPPNPTPAQSSRDSLNLMNRRFILDRPQALNPLRRLATQTPGLREFFPTDESFNRQVAGNILTAETRESLGQLTSLQNSLFTNQFSNGDISRMPSAEVMFDMSKDNNNKLISIASELGDCCEELKSKLEDVKMSLKRNFKDIKDALSKGFDNISSDITKLKDWIFNSYQEEKGKFLEGLESEKEDLSERFRTIIKEELAPLDAKVDTLSDNLNAGFTRLENKLSAITASVDHLESLLVDLTAGQNRTISVLETIVESISGLLIETTAQTVVLGEISTAVTVVLPAALTGIETTVGSIFPFIEAKLILDGTELKSQFSLVKTSINENTDKDIDDLKEDIDDRFEKLPEETAEKTSLSVVGEAYTNFDSRRSYHPTVIFLFVEKTESTFPRRSQIKLRLKKENSELTEEDQYRLRSSIKDVEGLSYLYGTNRGNYVSADRRFKTTLFANSLSEIEKVLETLLPIIGEPFQENLLSLTSNGKSRPSATKRNTALGSIPLNEVVYNEPFTVELAKAKLLVNGLAQPVVLYP